MMPNLLIRYKFSILLAIVIALLSLIPGNSMPDTSLFSIPGLDKIGHFGMYSLLSFVALLESHRKPSSFRFHTLLFLGIFSLSIIIELLQATVITARSAEWLDLLANASGLLSGYLAFRVFRMVRS